MNRKKSLTSAMEDEREAPPEITTDEENQDQEAIGSEERREAESENQVFRSKLREAVETAWRLRAMRTINPMVSFRPTYHIKRSNHNMTSQIQNEVLDDSVEDRLEMDIAENHEEVNNMETDGEDRGETTDTPEPPLTPEESDEPEVPPPQKKHEKKGLPARLTKRPVVPGRNQQLQGRNQQLPQEPNKEDFDALNALREKAKKAAEELAIMLERKNPNKVRRIMPPVSEFVFSGRVLSVLLVLSVMREVSGSVVMRLCERDSLSGCALVYSTWRLATSCSPLIFSPYFNPGLRRNGTPKGRR